MAFDLLGQVESKFAVAGIVAVVWTGWRMDVVRLFLEEFHTLETVGAYPLSDDPFRVDSLQAHAAIVRRVRFTVFAFSCHIFILSVLAGQTDIQ